MPGHDMIASNRQRGFDTTIAINTSDMFNEWPGRGHQEKGLHQLKTFPEAGKVALLAREVEIE